MPAHTQLLAALKGSQQVTSDAMSPFAGFAALSKGRASVDAGDPNQSFTANQAYRHRRKSVHIEDMVKDKVLRQVPRHIRQSLDRAGSEAGRRSHEFAAPPPAQSTGMRNSHEGVRARSFERASSLAPSGEPQRELSAEKSQHSQEKQSDGPLQDNSRAANGLQAPAAASSSGLSQYSPFASQGLGNPTPNDN